MPFMTFIHAILSFAHLFNIGVIQGVSLGSTKINLLGMKFYIMLTSVMLKVATCQLGLGLEFNESSHGNSLHISFIILPNFVLESI